MASSNQTRCTIPTLIERAGAWLLRSGIQEDSGGVARYYRCDPGGNQPVSTEITAYFASTLVYLNALTGDAAYLDAARRAARFLTRVAWDSALHTFPFEHVEGDGPPAPAYFFDCGIIVRGLLSAWRGTGESEFLETARICGRAMAQDFLTPQTIHPVLTLPGKHPAPAGRGWSRNPGCYQLKSALAWHDLSTIPGGEHLRQHYQACLAGATASHESFLPGVPEVEKVMDRIHAYCYFLEGLLPCAGQPEYARILSQGIRRAESWLYKTAPVFERSDAYAQLLRLRLFADALGVLGLDARAAEEEVSRIRGFQLEHSDRQIDGGFCFGRKGDRLLPFVNPASTAFCLQALRMWRQFQAGEFRADLSALI